MGDMQYEWTTGPVCWVAWPIKIYRIPWGYLCEGYPFVKKRDYLENGEYTDEETTVASCRKSTEPWKEVGTFPPDGYLAIFYFSLTLSMNKEAELPWEHTVQKVNTQPWRGRGRTRLRKTPGQVVILSPSHSVTYCHRSSNHFILK